MSHYSLLGLNNQAFTNHCLFISLFYSLFSSTSFYSNYPSFLYIFLILSHFFFFFFSFLEQFSNCSRDNPSVSFNRIHNGIVLDYHYYCVIVQKKEMYNASLSTKINLKISYIIFLRNELYIYKFPIHRSPFSQTLFFVSFR